MRIGRWAILKKFQTLRAAHLPLNTAEKLSGERCEKGVHPT
jgi:hypothetical protein